LDIAVKKSVQYLKKFFKSDTFFVYKMTAPSLILLFIVVIYPVLLVFVMSLSKISLKGGGIGMSFHGLKTYGTVLRNPSFLLVIKNSFYFAFYSLTIGMVLAFIITLALDKIKIGAKFFRTVLLLPWICPLVVSGMMWKWVLSDIFGIFNYILVRLNIINSPLNWVGSSSTAMKVVIWTDIWAYVPFCVLILYSGLQQIPHEIYESAKIDGAGEINMFFYITLPMLKNCIYVILLIRTIYALRAFDLIWILTQGGPGNATNVLGLEIYYQGIKFLNFGNASVLSILILLITFVICLIYHVIFRS